MVHDWTTGCETICLVAIMPDGRTAYPVHKPAAGNVQRDPQTSLNPVRLAAAGAFQGLCAPSVGRSAPEVAAFARIWNGHHVEVFMNKGLGCCRVCGGARRVDRAVVGGGCISICESPLDGRRGITEHHACRVPHDAARYNPPGSQTPVGPTVKDFTETEQSGGRNFTIKQVGTLPEKPNDHDPGDGDPGRVSFQRRCHARPHRDVAVLRRWWHRAEPARQLGDLQGLADQQR